MYKHTTAPIHTFPDKGITRVEVLNNILILIIIHFHNVMLIPLEQILVQGQSQGGLYMRHVGGLESSLAVETE